MKTKRIKSGVYRLSENMVLVRTPGSCLRGVGHNRRGNATKKCVTWKLYKTAMDDQGIIENLSISGRALFGAVVTEEFESMKDAVRVLAQAIAQCM